jgi:hypothetical protein
MPKCSKCRRQAIEQIDALFEELDRLPTEGWPGPEPLLEIRENPRMMRSVLAELRTVRRKLRRLPHAVTADHQDGPRATAVADAYLAASGCIWNADALRIYLDELQRSEPLLLEELWVLPVALRFILLEQILDQATARRQALSFDDGVPQFDGPAAEPAFARLLTTRIQSLREIAYVDWFFVMEPLVADDFYIGGIEIITILLMAAVIAPLAAWYHLIGGLTLAFFLLLLPAAQGTVDLFNNIVSALFKARSRCQNSTSMAASPPNLRHHGRRAYAADEQEAAHANWSRNSRSAFLPTPIPTSTSAGHRPARLRHPSARK